MADEFIQECHMNSGTFDNVQACRYKIPDYWDIGEVYERLIEDCYDDHKIVRWNLGSISFVDRCTDLQL